MFRMPRRVVVSVGLTLGVAIFVSGLLLTEVLEGYHRRVTDAFSLPATLFPRHSFFSDQTLLVAIDDKSVAELRGYGPPQSWPRTLYAGVLRRLTEGRARTVAFDVPFDAPAEGDDDLAAAIDDGEGHATMVVLSSIGELQEGTEPAHQNWDTVLSAAFDPRACLNSVSQRTERARPPTIVPQPRSGVESARQRLDNPLPCPGDPRAAAGSVQHWSKYTGLKEPLAAFAQVASMVGISRHRPDADGIVRRHQVVVDVGGQPYPSLALTSVATYLRRPGPWEEDPTKAGQVSVAGRIIDIDERGTMAIDYASGPHQTGPSAYPVVSFVDVLNGRVPPETFRLKLVLIGMTTTSIAEKYWTPTSNDDQMDGVEIHAQVLENIWSGRLTWNAPSWLTIRLIFGFAVLAEISLLFLPFRVAAVICGIALFGYLATAAVPTRGGMILDSVYVPLSLLLTFAAVSRLGKQQPILGTVFRSWLPRAGAAIGSVVSGTWASITRDDTARMLEELERRSPLHRERISQRRPPE
jgi:CHASE2 domain-containing sensor protein